MRLSLTIDLVKVHEWGLDKSEIILFPYLFQAVAWTETMILDGAIWHRMTRRKIIQDLPCLTDKPDTVYRVMKRLEERSVIDLTKVGSEDYFKLTDKGKTWNEWVGSKSEKLGFKSEHSDEHPSDTYSIYTEQGIPPNPQRGRDQSQTKKRVVFKPDLNEVPGGPSRDLIQEWIDYRIEIKKPYKSQKSVDKMISRLRRMADGSFNKAKEIIDQAIANGWVGFFDIKTRGNESHLTGSEILDEAYQLAKQYGARTTED